MIKDGSDEVDMNFSFAILLWYLLSRGEPGKDCETHKCQRASQESTPLQKMKQENKVLGPFAPPPCSCKCQEEE